MIFEDSNLLSIIQISKFQELNLLINPLAYLSINLFLINFQDFKIEK
jgi:hypothetical protein